MIVRRHFPIVTFRCASTSAISHNKPVISADHAISRIPSSATVLVGGFGLCGIPSKLIGAIQSRSELNDLTVVSNNAGVDDYGLGLLLKSRQIRKIIASYVGENGEFARQYLQGELEVELTPQGTLAERLRAGGAGIPAFYTATGAATDLQHGRIVIKYQKSRDASRSPTALIHSEPRESRTFNNREHLLEHAITGDFALVRAWKADQCGNCIFRGAAQNFNPLMAKAARECFVEAEEIVATGSIAPEHVHLPGIYVGALVQADASDKRIERVTLLESSTLQNRSSSAADVKRERIIKRAALEFQNGMYVNLGIGMPMSTVRHIPAAISVILQSENGILGFSDYPASSAQASPDLINAGKETITLAKGASLFSSSESFAMIRSGRLDLTMLGAMQVSSQGDLANWIVPGKMVKGPGGAMDLAACGSKVVVIMEHLAKKGGFKVVGECSLPLTGRRVVDRIITEMCVFDVDKTSGGLTLVELSDGTTIEQVRQATGCAFKIAGNLGSF